MEKNISNKQILRYLSGACFMLLAFRQFYLLIQNGFSFLTFISLIAYVLLTVSTTIQMPILMIIGTAALFVDSIISKVTLYNILFNEWFSEYVNYYSYSYYFKFFSTFFSIAPAVFCNLFIPFTVLYWLFIFIACFNKKHAKHFFIAAGIAMSICSLFTLIGGQNVGFWNIILILAAFLLAFSYEKVSITSLSVKAPAKETANDLTEQLMKIENLKNLLDSGVITSEEFESKKKQILNL